MKNLKTIIILIVVLLFTQVAVAQLAKPTFIIRGGVSSASFIWENDLMVVGEIGDNRIGYSFGLDVEFPINKIIDFETGLLLARKGMKLKEKMDVYVEEQFGSIGTQNVTTEYTPLYLEIPLNLKFVKPLSGISLYGTAGAYLGYGIAGKIKYSHSDYDYDDDYDDYDYEPEGTYSRDIEWGSGRRDDLKPLDLGGCLGFGVIIDKIEAGLYGSTSFINISSSSSNGNSTRNVVFGLMVGYRL
ncbi:MAG: porin family protein [Candidatus Cloacimonadales bacterium]